MLVRWFVLVVIRSVIVSVFIIIIVVAAVVLISFVRTSECTTTTYVYLFLDLYVFEFLYIFIRVCSGVRWCCLLLLLLLPPPQLTPLCFHDGSVCLYYSAWMFDWLWLACWLAGLPCFAFWYACDKCMTARATSTQLTAIHGAHDTFAKTRITALAKTQNLHQKPTKHNK